MRRIQFEGKIHQFPDDATDEEIARALGVSGLAGPAPDDRTTAGRLFQDYVANPLTGAIGQVGRFIAQTGTMTPENLLPATEEAARDVGALVVPQSLTQLGAQAGTMGAGRLLTLPVQTALAVGPKVAGAVARTAGAASGAAIGALAEGRDPLAEGTRIGGTTALLEGAIPVVGAMLRWSPGAKGRIAADDAARFGQWLEGQTGGTIKVRTAEEMRAVASGPGRTALGDAKEVAVGFIEDRVLGGGLIRVPALGGEPMTLRAANLELSKIGARAFSKNPLERTVEGIDQRKLYGEIAEQIREGIITTERELARAAVAAGQETIGRASQRALPPPSGPTVAGPNRTFEVLPTGPGGGTGKKSIKVAREVPGEPPGPQWQPQPNEFAPPPMPSVAESGGPLVGRETDLAPSLGAAVWDVTQENYKRGLAALKLLERRSTYRMYSDDIQFNTPALQEFIAIPRNEAMLRNKLGDEGFEKLADTLLRGGKVGTKDILAWGKGDARDAVRMLLEMRGGTGAILGAIPKTVFPNLASRYAGRTPFQASPTTQGLIDIVGQSLVTPRVRPNGPRVRQGLPPGG